MTNYYFEENGKIEKTTPFEEVAKEWSSYKTTEENIVYGYDGCLYLESQYPEPPAPTEEEQRQKRAEAYRIEKDPITCQIDSLRDEEQTPEVVEEINELLQKRAEVVKEIKERYPYPVENDPEYDIQIGG